MTEALLALQSMSEVIRAIQSPAPKVFVSRSENFDSSPQVTLIENIGRRLVRDGCTPFYWTPKTCALLAESIGQDLDDVVLTESLLPAVNGFMEFSRPMKYPQEWALGSSLRSVAWTTWSEPPGATRRLLEAMKPDADPSGTVVFFIIRNSEQVGVPSCGVGLPWKIGTTLKESQDVYGGAINRPEQIEGLRYMSRLLAAASLFLKQRVVQSVRAPRLSRGQAKWLEPQYHDMPIEIVSLRTAEASVVPKGSEAREWHCQWIVRGHWRQQWFPSLKKNQPRWIQPYIKGPGDAPLKPASIQIMAVTR